MPPLHLYSIEARRCVGPPGPARRVDAVQFPTSLSASPTPLEVRNYPDGRIQIRHGDAVLHIMIRRSNPTPNLCWSTAAKGAGSVAAWTKVPSDAGFYLLFSPMAGQEKTIVEEDSLTLYLAYDPATETLCVRSEPYMWLDINPPV